MATGTSSAVAGDVTSLLSAAPPGVKVTVGVEGKRRNTVREQLSMLVGPPPVLEVLEAILHEEVAKRPPLLIKRRPEPCSESLFN